MSGLKDLLDAEGVAAEEAEADQKSPPRADAKVARGHDRAKTLQVRLNEDELGELTALAADRGLPVSTVARQLLLQSLAPADDLKSALDRLERDVSAVRRKALSA
ncbi:MAG: ribbon-helix-helix protein, CopG family [Nocardioidaceae bacterium]|nr:ribbon-helix-helix protein, CopG family [Nocardioidaceae bacterium]